MKEMQGNLLTLFNSGYFDIIVHGCNCKKNMKSGIAKEIVEQYPEVSRVDDLTTNDPLSKLGAIQVAKVSRPDNIGSGLIINAYTQENYGRDPTVVYVDYDAVADCFWSIRNYVINLQKIKGRRYKIGIPRIGSGLANGDWSRIRTIIDSEFREYHVKLDLTLVTLPEGEIK